jgi:ribonuclease P protein component
VKQTGRRVKAGHLDVRVAPSPLFYARVGIIVPKYKRTVVERNRLRRRLRELVRIRMLPTFAARNVCVDVLLRTLPRAYEMTFDELAQEIDRLVTRIA